MARGRPPWMAVLAAVLLALLGCRRGAERVARAAEQAEPHLERFERFDRWARRAVVSDTPPRRDALAEQVFAPVRNQPELLAAWVELDGARTLTLALPPSVELPEHPRWVTLRDRDRDLGSLQVASYAPCVLSLPSWWRRGPIASCVLIARRARGPGARTLTVTMAFRSAN